MTRQPKETRVAPATPPSRPGTATQRPARRLVALGGALLLMVAAAACAQGSPTTAVDPGATTSSGEVTDADTVPPVEDLTCYTNMRSMGTIDYFTSASAGNGATTPEEGAQAWAKGDKVAVTDRLSGSAVVWVLRPDGTAHTRLTLNRFEDGTWGVGMSDSCSDTTTPDPIPERNHR